MKILSAEVVCTTTKPDDYPKDGLPEIAFVGRSNVGKSSLINVLLNRKGLAKTSSTPGKTRTINFYRINNDFYFVDLPGYGYAKVPKAIRSTWKPMVENYFHSSKKLKLVIVLFDIRRTLKEDDLELLKWLQVLELPVFIVLTKSDKLRSGERKRTFASAKTSLEGLCSGVYMFSSLKREGKDALWRGIKDLGLCLS